MPLDWLKKLRTPGAIVAVVRVWEQELDSNVLDLTLGSTMTEGEASIILSYHRTLRVLNATACEGITDKSAVELSEGLQNMQTLVLAKCPKLSDQTLQTLAFRFERLSKLDLDGCPYAYLLCCWGVQSCCVCLCVCVSVCLCLCVWTSLRLQPV